MGYWVCVVVVIACLCLYVGGCTHLLFHFFVSVESLNVRCTRNMLVYMVHCVPFFCGSSNWILNTNTMPFICCCWFFFCFILFIETCLFAWPEVVIKKINMMIIKWMKRECGPRWTRDRIYSFIYIFQLKHSKSNDRGKINGAQKNALPWHRFLDKEKCLPLLTIAFFFLQCLASSTGLLYTLSSPLFSVSI